MGDALRYASAYISFNLYVYFIWKGFVQFFVMNEDKLLLSICIPTKNNYPLFSVLFSGFTIIVWSI